jgi:protein phosphatase
MPNAQSILQRLMVAIKRLCALGAPRQPGQSRSSAVLSGAGSSRAAATGSTSPLPAQRSDSNTVILQAAATVKLAEAKPTMTITLRAAWAKDRGQLREINEDDVYGHTSQLASGETLGLFIVCDGMGGHLGGEFASKYAIHAIVDELHDLLAPTDLRRTVKLSPDEATATADGHPSPAGRPEESGLEHRIQLAVRRANTVVRDFARNRPAEAGDAGATVTMVLVKGRTAYVANVGDSRTYLLREGWLKALTKDHSLVASLAASGQIKAEEIYSHPGRNVILRSLGGKADVEADIYTRALLAGDRILLCSDGLWEMVRDPQITVIMAKAPSPTEACQRLIRAANDNGGEDNISAVVFWVEA